MSFDTDQNSMDNDDECENMVSNLPLLFANGYPTSLDKMSESQLEAFIPFMVQCSLGNIQIQNNTACCEPEWWPDDVEFCVPLKKSAEFDGFWLYKLKEIVAMCYTFHKSVFLLRFCENLALYQPEFLRFINNYNSTTSLFDRISNKLLVTFRNENMLYDQPPVNNKKTLMPRTHSSQSLENNNMVEQALFDIYLCDNCEAELYSLDAYLEHEKICVLQDENEDDGDDDDDGNVGDDDDVIFCGEEEYQHIDMAQQQLNFLQNFQLSSINTPQTTQTTQIKQTTPHKRNTHQSNNSRHHLAGSSACKDIPSGSNKKIRKITRRGHAAMILSKCPVIPISSPAGQQLMKSSNTHVNEGYVRERLERSERFCSAPILGHDGSNRPKFLDKKVVSCNITSYRKTNDYLHYYNFPRRQFSTKSRREAIERLHAILLKQSKCKPLRVSLKRLSNKEIESYQMKRKMNELKRKRQLVIARQSKMAYKANVIDYIDLCSSDEESDEQDNYASEDTNSCEIVFTSDLEANDKNNNTGISGLYIADDSTEANFADTPIDSYDRLCDSEISFGHLENCKIERSDSFSTHEFKPYNPIFDNVTNNNSISITSISTNNSSKTCDSTTSLFDAITSKSRTPLSFLSAKTTATVTSSLTSTLATPTTDDVFNNQNQENTFHYINGGSQSPTHKFIVENFLDTRIGKDITITKRKNPSTIQTSNFISIDLTL